MSKQSNVEDFYPLAPLQKGLLFHSLYAPGSGAYIEQLVYPLEGHGEDLDLLGETFQRLVDLHPVLRTSFVWERRDEPLQVVVRKARLSRETLDWSALPAGEADARLAALMEADRQRGFDLSRPLLLRIFFVLLPHERSLLLLTYHHILLDGWSISLILEDLFTLYRAFRDGVEPHLEARPPYRAYIDWLASQDPAAAESFWRHALAGVTAPTPLPAVVRPARADGVIEPAQVEEVMPRDLTGKLRTFAQQSRLTLNTVLQAAWALLLSRSGGGGDVLFGATSLGRPDSFPGIHRMIGLLVNTLPVRVRVPASAWVPDWLTALQTAAFERRRFELTPLAEIQKWSDVPRGTPLFETILDVTVSPAAERHDFHAKVHSLVEATHFPLTVDVADHGDLTLSLAFDRARLDRIDALRLAQQLTTLLDGFAAAGPGTRVENLSLLTEAARHQVTFEWNDSLLAVDRDTCLPRRFELQAVRAPDRVALDCDGESLTYCETSRRVRRLTRRLRAAGAGPGVTVGLCTGRSLDMVIALLAILRTGSAYLPLDPDLPAERLAFLLEDSQAGVLLIDERLGDRVSSSAVRAVGLTADLGEEEESDPELRISAESLAYVLYTSGSTGRPKGVGISHGALVNFLESMRLRPGIGPNDRLAAVTTLSFDIAGLEIYLPLLAGATVIVVPREVAADGERLSALLAEKRATLLQATPATWRLLLAAGWSGRGGFKALCGGEALPRPLAEQLLAASGEVWNMYGPTETTIWSAVERVGPGTGVGCVSIGRPIANTRLLVLDPFFAPAAPGAAGELFIGGDGLAQGYVGRPDLTAERFVPDPFDAAPGARLYRTGDLARTSADGRLEYLGRTDHQVKVRGFRIELGEIEAALVRHPAIAEAVVAVRDDSQGDRRLVAYLVLRGHETPSADALRQSLERTLPEPMIPAIFVVLEALPLTANGKVDRKALPEPGGERPHLDQELVPPRTDLERRLARIWTDVLGLDRVGAHDSFFALGGDSILGIRVLAQARREGLRLTLPQLLRGATIERLARELGEVERPADELSTKSNVEDLYSLTPLQQGLLFHSLYTPGSGTYVEQLVSPLDAGTGGDLGRLQQAIQRVVDLHPILRTAFVWERRDEPLQVVARKVRVPQETVDWQGLEESEAADRLAAFLEADRRRGFELSRPPLVRTACVRLPGGRTLLVFTFHHILLDGWSVSLVFQDLFALYRALGTGEEPSLAPRPPFRAYVDWLAGQDPAAAEAFWRRTLSGFTAPTPLPAAERPAPAGAVVEAGDVRGALPPELTAALRSFARKNRLTLRTLLQAAWALLLGHYGGGEDVVFGTTVLGRPDDLPGVDRIIGLLINTLPVRVRLASSEPVLAGLSRLQDEAFELRRFELSPLAEVQKWSDVPRGTPLFESLLDFEVAPGSGAGAPSHSVAEMTHFPLTVDIVDRDELALAIAFDRHRFDRAGILRVAAGFAALLGAVAAAEPETHISDLSPLGESERHQLTVEWNEPWPEGLTEIWAPRLFERRAEESPEAVALVCGGDRLSYREANRRANRLARRLLAAGAGPGALIAVCAGRSLDLVLALLAVHKAGGAYLPLDPDLPGERLEFLLADACATLLLVQESLLERLPENRPAAVLLEDQGASGPADDESPVVPIHGESLAYVIYTSGSTGRPKGVAVTHANLIRLFQASEPRFGFGAGDVWTLFHSYAFDFSVWEIWGALLHGGRLVVVPYAVSRSPEDFYRLLDDEQVTVLNQTPSAFRQLIRAEEAAGAAPGLALRWVIFGGEALEPASLRPWISRHGDRRPRLVNMYGITETTVHVTWREIAAGEVDGSVIGRPLGDLSIHLLGPAGELVPVGAPGEICVGGRGLARGYLRRPDLTASRFVPDPFAPAPGARLYRSGDVARRLADGGLEYLGRIDHQVKVRGFRIELGEIEAALVRHPAVAETVVTARRDAQESSQLVAYVVSRGAAAPETTELRRHLGRLLPDYMIPASFVGLAALPLTPNGKVDRAALPAPSGDRPELTAAFVAPRTELERRIAAIWSEVLGIGRVGIDDSFFALGGDSIRGIQVAAQARRQGIELTLQQLFSQETVGRLAAVLAGDSFRPEEERAFAAPFSLVSAGDRERLPATVVDAYPVTQLQAGMLFHGELAPGEGMYHDVFSYHLNLGLDSERLRQALRQVAARHPILRTAFNLTGFLAPLQLVYREAEIPLREGMDLSHLSPVEQERILDEDFLCERRESFDWTRPPLLRLAVRRRGAETFQLSVVCHHAILDGWSLATLLSELFQEYTSLLRGAPLELPAPAAAFREAVALEVEALASRETQSYWRRKLADAPRLVLPRWPREEEASGSVQRDVPPETFARLDGVARQARVPLKSVVLAAHLRVLALWGGQADVVTGLVSSGRPESEDGERVLGLFLNTLPLRLELPGGSWLDLVQAAFAADNENLPHRRYPLAQIQRDTGGVSLFETTVNFMHFHVYESAVSSRLELLGRKSFERNNFALAVNFWVEPGARHACLMLDSSELSAAQLESIASSYARALESIARDPHGRYDTVSLLAGPAVHGLLREANDTGEEARGLAVHHLIEAQGVGRPDAPAVVCGAERLSYAQLDRLANRLAWRLRDAGVAPGRLVGLSLERSAHLVAALLGVLKAGGAYVPLDPSYPAERLAMIREDARLSIVLNDGTLEELLAASDPRESAPPVRSTPLDALAYVMFTSGSTGRPKGVQVSHGALANFLESMRERPGIGPADRLAAVTTLSFDIAGLELYLPLIAGACVVVVPREVVADGERLRRLLEESGSTLLQATPATWHLLLAAGWTGGEGFRALCGGEALEPRLAARLLEVSGEVWNLYGPTETTIWSSVERVRGDATKGSVPLGRPIANTELYVLDRFFAPVPVLAPGELVIGGAGLAWGYLRRPDLTAERFVPDPFSGRPGARLYRTGDLARTLPDGRCEYLGRMDHQVKLRGFRIELGEIEAALAGHPAVARTAAQVREDRPGDRRLVAYVVPRPDAALDVAELRAHVRSRVPEFMVPSAWVELAELPLTLNGKVDRKALPAPETPEPPAAGGRARMPVEELLAQVWADVLGRESIGVHERFLDLGGHSLLAIQVLARVRQALGVELPLRTLFEEPTVAGMARRIAESEGGPVGPALGATPRVGEPVLSFAQERLWFLDQLTPGNSLYNLPGSLRFRGEIEPAALERALDEIRSRHEILRTRYATVEGRAVVRVRPVQPIPLARVDLSGLPEGLREAELDRLVRDEARRPFDLAEDELLRACLVCCAMPDHVLLLTVHHIVSDGPSMALLNRELRWLYAVVAAGEGSPLAPLPLQYLDYAAWQRSWMHGEVLDAELAFWREHLAGAPALLDLPTDRPWPAVQSFRGASHLFVLEAPLAERLHRLARQAGVTSFMVLVAGFATVLARSAGQWDVPLGTPVSGRTRVELEELMGLFANTLVLRPRLDGVVSFRELLGRVRDEVLAVHAHQTLPFERLVDALVPERSLQHSPLFQAALAYERSSGEDASAGLEALHVASATAKFELNLSFQERPGVLAGSLEYSTDLFDATTCNRLVGHFARLLAAAVAKPDLPALALPLLLPAERHQVLSEWNDTARRYRHGVTLHALVAEQAARTPEAVAASFEGEELTYRELDQKANELAGRLLALRVAPEERVGVQMERSLNLIVALLGILKAGAAWVPIDPTWPAERRLQIAASAGARVVLPLPPETPAAAPPAPASFGEDEGSLAYVLFTSGSTGVPKGVMIPHAGIVNRLLWMQEAYGLTPEDRVLQKTPFTFDVSVWEFFWPLLVGARLVFARPEGHKDPAYLVELLAAEKITTLHFVPSMLQVFLEAPGLERLRSLRRVMASGEALPPELVRRFFARLPHAELHNLYGPTEASVDVSCWPCVPEPKRSVVPIGRPIANLRLYVMSRDLHPVPIGVAGELLLGGVGLARGYLGRPELTAAAFVPDPCSETPGERLYRTGDLTRFLPDGQVEYLGRIDFQVKIRGFRIELGEIEAVLAAHPAVGGCVVGVVAAAGDRRLVAWVVLADPPAEPLTADPAELSRHLHQRLPDYMVPSFFVFLDAFPVTASGKVDRKALPAPQEPVTAEAFVAPRTPVEEILAAIWGEVLGLDRIGVEDSFFQLGGDSILGIRVVAKARKAGLALTPRQIFEHRTIAKLAMACGAVVNAGPSGEEPMVGDVPLTPIQLDFFAQDLPSPHHFNQAVLFEARLRLDPGRLTAAVGALLEHHDALRLRFHRDGATWSQRYAAPDGAAPCTEVDLSALAVARQPRALEAAAADLQGSLDLARGPLLQVASFDLGTERPGRLLLLAHHLVIDGVSWRVLLEDLETAYRRACGERVELPAKTTSYQRWAAMLHERAQSPELHAEAPFWLAQASRAAASLPRDLSGRNTRDSACTLEVQLDAAETEALLREAPRAYQTRPDELLLTALLQVLGEGRPGTELRFDLEGHGREDLGESLDLSRTVGWFTSLYPLVLRLDDPAPGEALQAVKEQMRAVPGGGAGYGLLRHLSGEPVGRELERAPGAELVFNYLGQLGGAENASSLFVAAREAVGPLHATAGQRRHVLEVNAVVAAGRLRVTWTWSRTLHRRATVEHWAGEHLVAVRALVAHCRSVEAPRFTPSDFPMAELDSESLQRLALLVERMDSEVSL